MEKQIKTAISWYENNQHPVLAIVTETWGSAPRQAGSLMVIRADQAFDGSVSGGCVEGDVIAEASKLLPIGGSKNLMYQVSNDNAFATGLICGGTLKITLIVITKDHVEPLNACLKAIQARKTSILAINLSTGLFALEKPEKSDKISLNKAMLQAGTLFIPILPKICLYITGAVAIAQILAPMACGLGFAVTIIDPRGLFTDNRDFGRASISKEWPDDFLKNNPLDDRTAVVALTHDEKLDDAALGQAIISPAFYIGALGSKRTHAKRLERLHQKGIAPESTRRIHAPIGMNIGAANPSEIAVAILAEIIQTLRHPKSPHIKDSRNAI